MITKEQTKIYVNELSFKLNDKQIKLLTLIMSNYANHCIDEYKNRLKEEIDILKYNIHSLNKSGIIIALDSLPF